MISTYDWIMIAFYFAFVFGMGFFFAGFNKNPSDYFRGGASMVWWMVGVTAFMTQFSAWTFIGASSKAYEDGFIVAVIFFGNALGFLLNALWSGPIFRQMRLITSIESVRERFDRVNEQVFLWLQVPISLTYSGIWLNALAVFIAAVFGIEIEYTIIATGIVVVGMSATGGSWAVVASDFIQASLLMTVAVLMAVLTLMAPEVGGVTGFLEKMPAHHWNWSEQGPPAIIWLWVVAYIVRQIITTNSLMESYRYFYVKDGQHARWAGFLAFGLMTVGPFLWFIPPMAAAFIQPDLASVYPQITKNVNETAYVFMGQKLLPPGMLGLLLCGMFAATMSSMDAGLNRNSGILIKNLYQPWINPGASEKHLLAAGIIASCLCGAISIFIAFQFSQLKDVGLFKLMQSFATLVALPLAMPMLLSLIFWRTPPWSGWATALVGFMVSLTAWLFLNYTSYEWLEAVPDQNLDELEVVVSAISISLTTTYFFIRTGKYYDSATPQFRARVEAFKELTRTPVDFEKEIGPESDNKQARTLGWMCLCYGGFLAALALLPNTVTGHVCFLVTGGMIGGIGTALVVASRRVKKTPATTP